MPPANGHLMSVTPGILFDTAPLMSTPADSQLTLDDALDDWLQFDDREPSEPESLKPRPLNVVSSEDYELYGGEFEKYLFGSKERLEPAHD